MQKTISSVLLMALLLIGFGLPVNSAFAQPDKVDVLIGFNGKPDESLVKQNGGKIKNNFHPFINVLSVELPVKAIEGLKHNPKISYIEFDLIATIDNHPSAIGEYSMVWGVDHIKADIVHATGITGSGVDVVVIDTGINSAHPDIGNNYKGGHDYVNGDNNPNDDHGHGSHVSGTVAGVANNVGIIGVSPQVNLYGVKVLDSSGSGSYSNVINGIMWAADNHMDVANLSLGGGASTSLCDAVTAATNSGVLIIASAGNSGNFKGKGTNTGYPATCQDAIAVAATTQSDSRASFSSTGPAVEISAPGVGIYSSLLAQSYGSWSGTSMAAPHVSGVAALIKDANDNLTPQDIREILQTTAIDLGDSGRDNLYGFGLVNTIDAVAAAGSGNVLPNDFEISANPDTVSAELNQEKTTTITINPINNYQGTVNISSTLGTLSPASLDIDGTTPASSTLTFSSTDTASPGPQTVTVTGTGGSLSHSTTINLNVIDPDSDSPSSVSVNEIWYERSGGRNNDKHLSVYVKILDDLNNPVSGASVTINLSCDCSQFGWSGTVSTDSSGVAKYTLNNAKTGKYSTEVTQVNAPGLVWLPGPNDTYGPITSSLSTDP